MKNKETIYLKRYRELVSVCDGYKGLYKELEARYEVCSCFHCKMRLVTLGMEIVSLNAAVEQMERDLFPPLEDILCAMDIPYTIEEGQVRLG